MKLFMVHEDDKLIRISLGCCLGVADSFGWWLSDRGYSYCALDIDADGEAVVAAHRTPDESERSCDLVKRWHNDMTFKKL